MAESVVKPNTFLIGVQKAATTSLFNWIAQHPEVSGPSSIKDYPFFIKDEFYKEGIGSLDRIYREEGYTNERVVMQGSVQYMFFKKASERISEYNPNSKIIIVLRNPVERAISAYRYFNKMNLETLTMKEAILEEEKRLHGTFQERCELTYVAHGLYAKQLKEVFSFFPRDQILILFYEQVKNEPQNTVRRVFQFLNIAPDFQPDFKILNQTGNVRIQWLQKLVFNQNKIKKFIVKNFLDFLMPLHKRTKLKLRLKEWNTKGSPAVSTEEFAEERKVLRRLFLEDICELEVLLKKDLSSWK